MQINISIKHNLSKKLLFLYIVKLKFSSYNTKKLSNRNNFYLYII